MDIAPVEACIKLVQELAPTDVRTRSAFQPSIMLRPIRTKEVLDWHTSHLQKQSSGAVMLCMWSWQSARQKSIKKSIGSTNSTRACKWLTQSDFRWPSNYYRILRTYCLKLNFGVYLPCVTFILACHLAHNRFRIEQLSHQHPRTRTTFVVSAIFVDTELGLGGLVGRICLPRQWGHLEHMARRCTIPFSSVWW